MKKNFTTNAVIAGILLGCLVSVLAAGKPNVLFIAIDDMNDWTTLFDKGNPIQTPNLERLARRGCFFTRAYCTTAICNPSRTAILTGLSPETSGVYSNGESWSDLLPDVVTLPQCFRDNGYDAIGGGKIFHHGKTGRDRKDNPSFGEFFDLKIHAHRPAKNHNGYTEVKLEMEKQWKKEGTKGQIKKDSNYRDIRRLGGPAFDWGVHDVAKQTDEYTVEFINKIMVEHPKDKPLFLAAGIYRPHLPFWAPPGSFARYPLDTLRMPEMPENDLDDIPAAGLRLITEQQHFIWEYSSVKEAADPGSLQRMVQSYQASADYADEMVGRLLDQLDATGRADDTIIVLWADHGYHLGDKTHCVKHTLWEKANHVPFIIVAPGITKAGSRCDRPVSLLDIYPTLAELAGIEPPSALDGRSLVPLLKNTDMEWEHPALMTYLKGNHAVRTQTHRYIRYADNSEELYADNDGWNITNLALNPEAEALLAQHRRLMDEAVKK